MAEANVAPGDELHPLRGPALLIAVLVLSLANFMAILDMSIANVAVPTIAGGLAVSPNEGTWVITSYSVAEAITVPLTGWLAARFGTVKVFIVAMGMFGLCSALCGFAPSLGFLVFFRVLQGLSGGPMMPLSQTLLMRAAPPNLRPQMLGLWVMTTVVAPIAGPVLGGAISDNIGWPWVFYVNVPVAILCLVIAIPALRSQETKSIKNPIDFVGLLLLIVAVGSFQIMLDKGKELDWFGSGFITILLIVAVTGFVALVIWELTDAHPVIDLRIFRNRGFSVGVLSLCLTYGSFFAGLVILPLWLQTNLGYTATWAGYAMAFNGMLMVVAGPIAARLVQKVDPRLMVFLGVLWVAYIFFLRSTYTTETDFFHIALPQFLQGVGMAFFFVPIMTLALGTLKPEQFASGAGLLNFMRTTSGSFAVSLATTAWGDSATRNRVNIVAAISGSDASRHQLNFPGASPEQASRMLDGLVQGQSVMLATNWIFQVIAGLMVISAISIWFAPKPTAVVQGGGH